MLVEIGKLTDDILVDQTVRPEFALLQPLPRGIHRREQLALLYGKLECTQVLYQPVAGFLRGVGNKADLDAAALGPLHRLQRPGYDHIPVVKHPTEIEQ